MRDTKRLGRHAPAHARGRRDDRSSVRVREADFDADGAGTVRVALADGPFANPDDRAEPSLPLSPAPSGAPKRTRSGRALLRGVVRRDRALTTGGAELRLLVLACTQEDATAVDLSSGSLMRLRIRWPEGHAPDLSPFDVVEATLADDPECDDLAQPEAATVAAPPRHVGSLHGRRVRAMLGRLTTTHDGPLLGFHGPSAPYWDFDGLRPSVALIEPTRAPQLMRRRTDGSTWVRFGWEREDVWLPVEDVRAVRALDASRRDRLAGRPLATALGFAPHYLLVALSSPRAGHSYKICQAVLPKG